MDKKIIKNLKHEVEAHKIDGRNMKDTNLKYKECEQCANT